MPISQKFSPITDTSQLPYSFVAHQRLLCVQTYIKMNQLRRINVFEKKPTSSSSEAFSSRVGFVTCGAVASDGSVWLGNTSGELLRVDHSLKTSSWTLKPFAHIKSIKATQQHIVLLGSDGDDAYRSYNIFKSDSDGIPVCSKEMKAPGKVTSFDVCHDFSFVAFGLESGQCVISRAGDFHGSDRQFLRTVLLNNKRPVTGVSFVESDGNLFLVVCTVEKISSFSVGNDGSTNLLQTEEVGASLLGVGAAGILKFAGEHGIFTFHPIQGNMGALSCEGRKRLLTCWRSYMALVSENEEKKTFLTIALSYPGSSSFMAFQHALGADEVSLILPGCFDGRTVLVVTTPKGSGDGSCYFEITEKLISEQLAIFVRKSMFDLAIEVATKERQSSETIADLFSLQIESLIASKHEEQALVVLKRSIDLGLPVEPSFASAKFLIDQPLSVQRCALVADYLLHLHKKSEEISRKIAPAHTRLLVECAKIAGNTEALGIFFSENDSFFADVPELLEMLSSADIDRYLRTKISKYSKDGEMDQICNSIDILAKREKWSELDLALKSMPETAMKLLLKIPCAGALVTNCPSLKGSAVNRMRMHMEFLTNPDKSPSISEDGDTLLLSLELALRSGDSKTAMEIAKRAGRQVADRMLILGSLFDNLELQTYAAGLANKPLHVLAVTGETEGEDQWLHGLSVARKLGKSHKQVNLRNRNVGLGVLIELIRDNPDIPLGEIKAQIVNGFASLEDSIKDRRARVKTDAEELSKMDKDIQSLRTHAKVIQPLGKLCAECKQSLGESGTSPVVYFLCNHFYHLHCATSDIAKPPECTLCTGEVKRKTIIKDQRRESAYREDDMFKYLTSAERNKGFDVIANYLGRGLFDLP